MPHRRLLHTVAPPLVAALAAVAPHVSHAQTSKPASCYGFAFGRWHPALDLAAAGHSTDIRPGRQTAEGRSWASEDSGGVPRGETGESLMLYPTFWPAGVRIGAARFPGVGDTVPGTATALVANGNVPAPRAQALVWGVPCNRPPQTAPAWATPSDSAVVAGAPASGQVRAKPARPATRPRP